MQAIVHPNGQFIFRGFVFRAALGRTGVTSNKREGDGATQAGLLPLRQVLYRADRVEAPACTIVVEPIARNDGWCDDPSHPDYNRRIRSPHRGHHEEPWRADAIYDIIGVLGWNDAPIQPGRGSAIFLHVASDDYAPTDGCIALSLYGLRAVLASGLTEILVLRGSKWPLSKAGSADGL